LSAALAAEKARASHLESDLAVHAQEISKANDIIRRLQADLRATKTKTKTRNTAIVQQEMVLEEREEEVQGLKATVEELKGKLSAAEESRTKERARAAELEAKVEEVKKQLEDKQNGGFNTFSCYVDCKS
jgi:spindle assembly abnormal protein 6